MGVQVHWKVFIALLGGGRGGEKQVLTEAQRLLIGEGRGPHLQLRRRLGKRKNLLPTAPLSEYISGTASQNAGRFSLPSAAGDAEAQPPPHASSRASHPLRLDSAGLLGWPLSSPNQRSKPAFVKQIVGELQPGLMKTHSRPLGRYYLPHYSTDWPYFIQGLLRALLTADERLHEYTK